MSRIYVALDLETTGFSPERDAIIEIGAIRFRLPTSPNESPIVDRWSTLVQPGCAIPYRITKLTGIRNEDVLGAPRLPEALDDLRRFVGNYPVVGHNISFELSFLQRHGLLQGQASLDTFELASILLPDAPRYSLGELAGYLDVEFDGWHRALADAEMAARLFLKLWQEARALPPETLEKIAGIAMQSRWPLRSFFVAAHRMPGTVEPAAPPTREPMSFVPREPLRPRPGNVSTLVKKVSSLLDEDGPFAQSIDQYEVRESQRQMMRHVAQAFQDRGNLIVEVGTGSGKSLAYLLAAVHLADETQEPVVVSTNTLNLQDQIYHTELPRLAESLDVSFTAMRLKGRGNYVCPRRVEVLRKRGSFTDAEARLLTRVLIWLHRTQTGDRAELNLQPDEVSLWPHLTYDADSCTLERCSPFGTCYWLDASRQVLGAHLIIVNHALLLADVATERAALPPYRYLIVDEAHHLEEQATQQFGARVSQAELYSLLDYLSVEHNGRARGLLDQIRRAARDVRSDQKTRDIADQCGLIERIVDQARTAVDDMLAVLTDVLASLPRQDRSQTIHPLDWGGNGWWSSVVRTVQQVTQCWESLRAQLGALSERIGLLGLVDDQWREFRDECIRMGYELQRLTEEVHRILVAPEDNDICWVTSHDALSDDEEEDNGSRITLCRAPLRVGQLLAERLFATKTSVILTSATLSVEGSFTYLREQLGIEGAEEVTLGSPYEYGAQAMAYLVTDLPEPNQPHYAENLHQALADLAIATEGRMLVLFTSKSQLNNAYRAISNKLAREDIIVLAQYLDGSRTQLLHRFRHMKRAVLLGTQSFWEGIDVPGPALSCVAITRLPFPVPVDPIQAARAKLYQNPFYEYTVPQAVLRFRQGVGRLLRTATDRGIVALLDTRLANKGYGDVFLNSLPPIPLEQGPCHDLPPRASRWLAAHA